MQVAMLVTWTGVIPGREKKALEYAAEVNEYWGKLAAEGKCTVPELFFSHGGHGMWMVKGERDTLREIEDGDVSKRIIATGSLLLENFGYEFLDTADAADEFMLRFGEVGSTLGYI